MKKIFVVLSLAVASILTTHAQVLLSGGLTYNQNFDSLASATVGDNPTWADNTTLLGWYASRAYTGGTGTPLGPYAYTSYRVDTGTANNGLLYSYGVAGVNPVTDRALGTLASGTPKTNAFGVLIKNDTASAVENVLISYTGEQWRNGSNAATHTLVFSYKIFSSAFSGPLDVVSNGSGWNVFSPLTFSSPTVGGPATALDGNATANRTSFSSVLLPSVTLNVGDSIMLRWWDYDNSGNDHAFGVDDFSASFSAVPEPSTFALAALGGLGVVWLRRRR
jgi:uncharacterized protein